MSGALLATLIQRWARRYQRVAYPRYSPQRRARIRAFYKKGVDRWGIPRAVEVLPALLHIALLFFFAGLSVFLFGVHRTIFKIVTAWIGACGISYAVLSVFPVIYKNSLYSTPLSALLSFYLTGIPYLFSRSSGNFTRKQLLNRNSGEVHQDSDSSHGPGKVHLDDFFSRSMIKTAEEYAFKLKPDIDHESLLWTFKSLDEDSHFEDFFEGLPRLCDSDTGKKLELKEKFIKRNKEELSNALIGLMDRTLISNLVKPFVKQRRMIIFTKVIESKSTSLLGPSEILRRVLFEDWHGFLECIEFGLSMQNWTITPNADSVIFYYARCVAALIISTTQIRDKRWIQLATFNAQSLPRSLDYNKHHHSILLANAIYIVRMSVQTYPGSEDTHKNKILHASWKTLGAVCNLDTRHTLPELQHEFCDLWNKLVNMARTNKRADPRYVSTKMLKNIRKLYIALHDTPRTVFHAADEWEQVLDNPHFYPECTENDHLSSSSFQELRVDAPRIQADAPVTSNMHQFPHPHPHLPSPLIPSNSTSSARPPSPPFPVPKPYTLPH